MLLLQDLLSADTEEQATSALLAFLSLAGFEVEAWQPGSVPRTMVRAFARAFASSARRMASIAAGGYLDTARAAWLDLLAWSHYQLTRKSAVATRGYLLFTDAGGGPHMTAPGQLILQGPGGLRYRTISGGEIPLSDSVYLQVEAEAPGEKYNVPTGSDFELLTPLPTVTVTAPPQPGTGSWLTVAGSDAESDASLIERCRARWPGTGYLLTTRGVYRAAALTASGEVTRVQVFPHFPQPGSVRVVVAGTGGPVSAAALAAVQTYLAERASVVVDVTVINASPQQQAVQATIFVQAAYAAGALARAQDALAALQQRLDLGAPLYRAHLLDALFHASGVENVTVQLPALDQVAAQDAYWSLIPLLTVVPV